MLSKLHSRLGTAGFIISIIALIAALSGGAYAASGGLSSKQKKEVKSIAQAEAKKFAGKPGAAGPAGPAGPGGQTGPAGGTGAAGAGGSPGAPGQPGSPWTAGGTLPSNATETGVWGSSAGLPLGFNTFPISFTIPLAEAPEPVLLEEGELTASGCPGVVGGVPSADPGKLCVYGYVFEGATFENFFHGVGTQGGFGSFATGADTAGTLLEVNCEGFCLSGGVWAVTAE